MFFVLFLFAKMTGEQFLKFFLLLGSLRVHMESAHSEGIAKPRHQCVECGRWFKRKAVMMEHMSTHTGRETAYVPTLWNVI